MNDKYYTPDLKEYHIGFEYEFSRIGNYEEWTSAVIKDGIQIDDIHNSVYLLRVKYLDKQDIESEGWKCITFTEKENEWYSGYWKKDSYTFGLHSKDFMTISKMDGENKIMVFQGTIKNISEFRKIIKMIC